jgi:spore germination protein YaaH
LRERILAERPLGMYYYTDENRSFESLQSNLREIGVLAPQSFRVDAEGYVYGEVPPRALDAARAAGVPVMPLVVNTGFDRGVASALLRDPQARDRMAMYLAYLAARDGYAGWQLDFERLDPADRDLYPEFARRIADRLHRDDRLLSVTVVPRFSDAFPDIPRTGRFFTGEWGAPYDFRALGAAVDFLTLMAYDQHNQSSPPGPVAGHEWVEAAVEYAVARVPPEKILLGIPFYGREWIDNEGSFLSRSVAHSDVRALLTQPEVSLYWDERWRSPWLRYRDDAGWRTIWFEDRRSLAEKLKLVDQYGLRGFAAWRLGAEDPEFWPVAALARSSPRAAR